MKPLKSPLPAAVAVPDPPSRDGAARAVEVHECRYFPKRQPGVPLRPWHDAPDVPCGCGRVGSLRPFNPGGWYGPQDSTLFCPACGTGFYGTDEQIIKAMSAEAWWDAFERQRLGEHAFAVQEGGC